MNKNLIISRIYEALAILSLFFGLGIAGASDNGNMPVAIIIICVTLSITSCYLFGKLSVMYSKSHKQDNNKN